MNPFGIHHELLKGQIISRMLFAVYDVHHEAGAFTGLRPSAKVRYSRELAVWAKALASVRDLPRMAFAPRPLLSLVPFNSMG